MITDPAPDHLAWIDGEFVPWKDATLKIYDHHFGYGVFEGVRAFRAGDQTGLFRLEDHTARLFRSAHILGMRVPEEFGARQLNQVQLDLVRKNGLGEAYLRPFFYFGGISTLSPKGKDMRVGAAVVVLPWIESPSASNRGLRLRSGTMGRQTDSLLVKAKAHANYMPAMLALREARLAGADDALLYDRNGIVAEATAANIMAVRDGELLSPPRHLALEGITRDTVLLLAEQMEIRHEERPLTRDDLYSADELFLTGTATGVTPVSELDGRPIGTGSPGPMTQRLAREYDACVRGKSSLSRDLISWI